MPYFDYMKKIFKELIPYLIIIVVVVSIRIFIVTPVQVSGDSMRPTLKNREILLLKKYDRSFQRFDIVVIDYDNDRLIKRIIGLPGETIKIDYSMNPFTIKPKLNIKETKMIRRIIILKKL